MDRTCAGMAFTPIVRRATFPGKVAPTFALLILWFEFAKYTAAVNHRKYGRLLMNRGKFAILIMLGLGISAATFAWWYRWQRGTQMLEVWGSRAAICVRLAPQVDLFRLQPLSENDSQTPDFMCQGRGFTIVDRRDISQARGLIHWRRHALLQRESFTWDGPAADCDPVWEYVLRFTKDHSRTTAVLDFDCQTILFLQCDREAGMAPISQSLRTFVEEQFESVGSPARAESS